MLGRSESRPVEGADPARKSIDETVQFSQNDSSHTGATDAEISFVETIAPKQNVVRHRRTLARDAINRVVELIETGTEPIIKEKSACRKSSIASDCV